MIDATTPVYVDSTSLARPGLTGVGRCVARIIQALAGIRPIRLFSMARLEDLRDHRFRTGIHQGVEVVLGPENLPGEAGDLQGWRDAVYSLLQRPFDRAAAKAGKGIYTFRRSAEKRFSREVSLCFDLTACLVPETHEASTRAEFLELVERLAPLDEKVMAISKSTHDDLVWLGGVPREKVEWCHLGPSQCLSQHAWRGACPARDPNLFLAVSTVEPRKNPKALLEWFLTSPVLPEGARLVWAGPKGWLTDQGDLPRGRGSRRVEWAGMVSDSDLCRLLSSARCLVYPSLYEGFGFPVLDALLHGTPVICSGNSSLLEFEGKGVHFADPCDPVSLDTAWDSCSREAGPVDRPDLRQGCSWDHFARRLLGMLD